MSFTYLVIRQIIAEPAGKREMVYMQDKLLGCLKKEQRYIGIALQVKTSIQSVKFCLEVVFRYCLKDTYHIKCTSQKYRHHDLIRLYAMCIRLNVKFNSTFYYTKRFLTWSACSIHFHAGRGFSILLNLSNLAVQVYSAKERGVCLFGMLELPHKSLCTHQPFTKTFTEYNSFITIKPRRNRIPVQYFKRAKKLDGMNIAELHIQATDRMKILQQWSVPSAKLQSYSITNPWFFRVPHKKRSSPWYTRYYFRTVPVATLQIKLLGEYLKNHIIVLDGPDDTAPEIVIEKTMKTSAHQCIIIATSTRRIAFIEFLPVLRNYDNIINSADTHVNVSCAEKDISRNVYCVSKLLSSETVLFGFRRVVFSEDFIDYCMYEGISLVKHKSKNRRNVIDYKTFCHKSQFTVTDDPFTMMTGPVLIVFYSLHSYKQMNGSLSIQQSRCHLWEPVPIYKERQIHDRYLIRRYTQYDGRVLLIHMYLKGYTDCVIFDTTYLDISSLTKFPTAYDMSLLIIFVCNEQSNFTLGSLSDKDLFTYCIKNENLLAFNTFMFHKVPNYKYSNVVGEYGFEYNKENICYRAPNSYYNAKWRQYPRKLGLVKPYISGFCDTLVETEDETFTTITYGLKQTCSNAGYLTLFDRSNELRGRMYNSRKHFYQSYGSLFMNISVQKCKMNMSTEMGQVVCAHQMVFEHNESPGTCKSFVLPGYKQLELLDIPAVMWSGSMGIVIQLSYSTQCNSTCHPMIIYRSFTFLSLDKHTGDSKLAKQLPIFRKMMKPSLEERLILIMTTRRIKLVFHFSFLQSSRYGGLVEIIDSLDDCNCHMTKLSYRFMKLYRESHDNMNFDTRKEFGNPVVSNYTLLKANNRSWEEAEMLCKKKRSHLFGIHNFAKLNSIMDNLHIVNWNNNMYIYIGLRIKKVCKSKL